MTQRKNILGLNGLGRIGKLTIWNQLSLGYFDEYVINIGREGGKQLEDLIDFLTTDSTYGALDRFLFGYTGKQCDIQVVDREAGLFTLNGTPIRLLLSERNPKDIPWATYGVDLVVDCTGVFLDPTQDSDRPRGSVRGHLDAGAKKVIVSAPFKMKEGLANMPADSAMIVYGINEDVYDADTHSILSSASCTTTALSHMMKPLLDCPETANILTASMSTIHAATNNQSLLDKTPGAGASDLRRNRSALNNIIVTSTGAAKALEVVLPQMKGIGFMADSVRIPTNTVSLVTLNLTFRSGMTAKGEPALDAAFINKLYKEAADRQPNNLLVFTDKQNVSSDFRGYRASVVVEGYETSTKTEYMPLPKQLLFECDMAGDLMIPVTHAKIFGWYDNEFGNYVNSLSHLIQHVHERL